MDGPLLWTLVALAAVVLVLIAAALLDLRRAEVRHLPKWGWALVILLVQFPIGVLLYLTVGRVSRAEHDAVAAREDAVHTTLDLLGPPTPAGAEHHRHLTATDPSTGSPRTVVAAPSAPAVATHGLIKAYGGVLALDDVDLVVPRGSTYGLIGPNGAGKTTMLSILAGLRRPTAGEIHLGVDRARIAVLVDTPLFEPWLTAREVVDLARHLVAAHLPTDRVDAALAEAGLADVARRRVGGFSRGMLQRVGLAACLVGDPQVLILDEPSSALDPAGRREVLDLVGRLAGRATVLLSTHILSDVQQVCDVVGVIDHGRLRYQGPIAELLARTATSYQLHVRAPAGELVRSLRRLSWVEDVEELAPGRLRLTATDAARAEHDVPRLVADHGLALVSFQPATDLETAFLELTR